MIPTDKIIDYYEKTKSRDMKKILETLKEAYIEYCGENARRKIDNVMDNLVICYYAPNLKQEELDYELKNARDSFYKAIQIILNGLHKDEKAEDLTDYTVVDQYIKTKMKKEKQERAEDLLNGFRFNYGYYLLIQANKTTDTDATIPFGIETNNPIVMNTKDIYDYYLEIYGDLIKNNKRLARADGMAKGQDNCIFLRGNIIKVSNLIHEINHVLHYEKLAIIKDENTGEITNTVAISSTHGTKLHESSSSLINEIINEHTTNDILNIFLKLYTGKTNLINTTMHGSSYIAVDNMCNNIGLKIYNLLKDEIKENLVSNIGIVKNIINAYNTNTYNDLEALYETIHQNLVEKSNSQRAKMIKDWKEESYKEETNRIYHSIEKSYSKYQSDKQNISNHINHLVDEGKARRIK